MYTKPVFKLYKLTVEIPATTKFFFGLFTRRPEIKEFYFKSEQEAVSYHGELYPETILKVEKFRAFDENDQCWLLQKSGGKCTDCYVFSDIVYTVINTNRGSELAIGVKPHTKRDFLHRVTLDPVEQKSDAQFFICAQPDTSPIPMSKHAFYKIISKPVSVTSGITKSASFQPDSDEEESMHELHLRAC